MLIRQFKNEDIVQINKIVLTMYPKWFTKEALRNIIIDTQINNCFIAEKDNEVVGFITYYSHNGKALINWLAVDFNYQRQGVGENLIKSVIDEIKKFMVTTLLVETIVEQDPPDGSYDETIKFYYKQGFRLKEKYSQETSDGFTFSKGILELDI